MLATELHFARTADRCGLSPSRVSQMLRELERQVGAPLFVRTSRHVALTAVGHELRQSLTPAYAQLLVAVDRARRVGATGLSGELRLGVYAPIAGGRHLPAIVEAFEKRHPSSSVLYIDTNVTSDMLGPLRRGEVDLAVLRRPLHEPDIVRLLRLAVRRLLRHRCRRPGQHAAHWSSSSNRSLRTGRRDPGWGLCRRVADGGLQLVMETPS